MIFVWGCGWVAKGENLPEAKASTQKDRGEREGGRGVGRGTETDTETEKEIDIKI